MTITIEDTDISRQDISDILADTIDLETDGYGSTVEVSIANISDAADNVADYVFDRLNDADNNDSEDLFKVRTLVEDTIEALATALSTNLKDLADHKTTVSSHMIAQTMQCSAKLEAYRNVLIMMN